jgi:hypothetical protein
MATAALALTLLFNPASAQSTRAAGTASWHFEPAQAPPPPPGVTAAPYAVQVGQVGDISFWSPNRGLLITGGTEGVGGPVPAGLYAYNGAEWHQLSTVCGGAAGRIAWAGPDEFWTISDQRGGQLLSNPNNHLPQSTSLCHFLNGEVVGSYAMPLEQPDSYMPMDAAACYGPDDCWFGGESGLGSAGGSSFHLHWNGSTLTAVYEPESQTVKDMINFGGQIYESVRVTAAEGHPAVLHTVAAAGAAPIFEALPIFHRETNQTPRHLPEYPAGVAPGALGGFSLGSDSSPLGSAGTQLWLAANPVEPSEKPAGSEEAAVTVLRYAKGEEGKYVWSQIPLSSLPANRTLSGAASPEGTYGPNVSESIAPEPGTDGAWLSLAQSSGGARVAFLEANGDVPEIDELPSALEPEPVGPRGSAGPIVCPAPQDCWMATNGSATQAGWLFHLTDGTHYEKDTDPNFNKLITFRPNDDGVPVVYPNAPPVDDSLANQQQQGASQNGPPLEVATPTPHKTKAVALVKQVHTKLIDHRTLVLSFTLTEGARVQLIARRNKAVVAHTRLESLRSGRHKLSLLLNPRRWPTGFQFKATPAGTTSPSGAGAEEAGSGDTIST